MSAQHETAAHAANSVTTDVTPAARRALGAAPRSVIAARHGRRDYLLRRVLVLADAVGITMALFLAAAFDPRPGANMDVVVWGLFALPAWIVLFKLYGLYERDSKRVSHTTLDDIPWLFHAIVIGTLLTWLYFKGVQHLLPLRAVIVFACSTGVFVLALRSFVRSMSVRLLGSENVLLVGEELMTQVLVRKMRAHPEYGLEPVGVVTAGARNGEVGVPVLGEIEDVPRLVKQHRIDRVVLSQTDVPGTHSLEIMRRCKELTVKVSLLPQVFDAMGPSVEIDDVEGVTLLGINPPVLARSSRIMKRALDLVGSLILTVVLAPVLVLVAIAIKIDSRGPVFFHQSRIGRGGKPFHVLKFRTMQADAEAHREELLKDSVDPNWLHLEHDPRITQVGRLLRLTSLDELPQLWNVIRGQMSLVGPRPLVESEDRMIVDGWARSRLDLTPGVTGVWQVLGRTNIPFEEMVKLDYLYVTNWSLWTDVRLIIRTLPAVVTRRGAN
jgi:exopolysaccharide biosynthesis polyprenyl glycosylphosphotransferase